MILGKLEKIKSIELYTNAHPKTTIKGTGYKDKKTALKTLELIKNKSIQYQFLLINVLYQRAKHHKNQTKNMIDAMNVFHLCTFKMPIIYDNSAFMQNYLYTKVIYRLQSRFAVQLPKHVQRTPI